MFIHTPLQGSPVPHASFPGPHASNNPSSSKPPQTQCPHACLPGALYLGQGSYYGTFHNASKEDQVQFCGPCGTGEGSQIVQDLLHGWREGVSSETYSNPSNHSNPTPPTPCPKKRAPPPRHLPQECLGQGPGRGRGVSLACSLGPR